MNGEALKQVIINADDFGLSRGVNRAIVECYKTGLLTSTSLMANMSAFEDAVHLCTSCPNLGIGVHLNLLRGAPVCDPRQVASLVNQEGRFWGKPVVLYRRFLLKRISLDEVQRELDAQIARVLDAGIRVTHLDSEKHTHLLLPGYAEQVCRAASRFDIQWVRRIRESVGLRGVVNRQVQKALLLNIVASRSSGYWTDYGLQAVDHSAGVANAPLDVAVYRAIFESLQSGVTEIVCHPGYVGESVDEVGQMYVDRYWEQERMALLDAELREIVDCLEVHLTHFGRL